MSKLVENYLLQEPIGKGVYGQVYRAVHQKTNQVFAVKVIPKASFRSNPKLQQLAINEINILSSIKHENIVKFIETLKTSNNFYFVYEYCNEGTLESQLQKKKFLKESQALIYFKQLIEAFKQLNKNNIMHRDLKPDNIFLSEGKIKLGDFGFCKMLEVNMAQTMLGSPIYMAPEILKEQIYTSKADIWSLGVVLFQMLFGYCPFESSSISELINKLKVLEVQVPLNINPISEETVILLKKMLVKDQFKRIEWVDLFDFVIDDRGKIVSGCKKQFRIETLENYFMNENTENGIGGSPAKIDELDGKLPLKQITSEKQPVIKFQSHKIINRPESKLKQNEGYESRGFEKGKNIEYKSAKEISSESFKNKNYDIGSTSVHEKTQSHEKSNFSELHRKWTQAIRLIQNLALNSVEPEKDEECLIILLTILLQKVENIGEQYPHWKDIIIAQRKAVSESLNELKSNREQSIPEKKQKQLKELYGLWKEARNKFTMERAIRAVFDQPSREISLQEILL